MSRKTIIGVTLILILATSIIVYFIYFNKDKHEEPQLIPYEVPQRGNENWEGYTCEISDLRGGELRESYFISQNPRRGCRFVITYSKDSIKRSVPVSMQCDEIESFCDQNIHCVCE